MEDFPGERLLVSGVEVVFLDREREDNFWRLLNSEIAEDLLRKGTSACWQPRGNDCFRE